MISWKDGTGKTDLAEQGQLIKELIKVNFFIAVHRPATTLCDSTVATMSIFSVEKSVTSQICNVHVPRLIDLRDKYLVASKQV